MDKLVRLAAFGGVVFLVTSAITFAVFTWRDRRIERGKQRFVDAMIAGRHKDAAAEIKKLKGWE